LQQLYHKSMGVTKVGPFTTMYQSCQLAVTMLLRCSYATNSQGCDMHSATLFFAYGQCVNKLSYSEVCLIWM